MSGIVDARISAPDDLSLELRLIAPITLVQETYLRGTDMAKDRTRCASTAEVALLVAELDQAETYAQKLRQFISDARDQLAAGRTAIALSLLNAALSDIDAATDVVTQSPKKD